MSEVRPRAETAESKERPDDSISVVLVDDSITIRAMLTALLRDNPELDLVGVAEDGESSVGVVLDLRPDVVIMDMQMPGISGVEAAGQILARWPDARIVMNTAYDDDETKTLAEEIGAVGYITKGQRASALIKTVLDAAKEPS